MAIIVTTIKPKTLLAEIKKAIDDGKIDTWEYDKEGDFTHSPTQWKNNAWLRPYADQGVLLFGLVGVNGVTMTKAIYGVYHGRFIEMLLSHFDLKFDAAAASALGEGTIDSYKALSKP